MEQDTSLNKARQLMTEFAALTGLQPSAEIPKRYLWTDAFAVCNFLELHRQTKNTQYLDLALNLVDQVHNILGRHRPDDSREGWLSGLDEEEGKNHPAQGGLRIGKSMRERGETDPYDEQLEWDRDGQYYHYLTKWMHALDCISRTAGETIYNRWARELAKTAHDAFTYVPAFGGRKVMYWKMSIDLSRPLVTSMGQHDPLDGYLTYLQLKANATIDSAKGEEISLEYEISEMSEICKGKNWATDDPLGIGGLLCGAYLLAQLIAKAGLDQLELLENMLSASLAGLGAFLKSKQLNYPAEYRLPFRELGLTIGLKAAANMRNLFGRHADIFNEINQADQALETLSQVEPVVAFIENFWLDDKNKKSASWDDHREINMVMLATSLAPGGFLMTL